MSGEYLEPSEWYASLPTVYMAAAVVLTDREDRVLVVKPTYRPYWALPGGVAEAGEAPHLCAAREAAEELGVTVPIGDLLVAHWAAPQDDRPRPMLTFVFDGGIFPEPGSIRLCREELAAVAWVSWEKAETLMSAVTAPRIPAARRARRTGRPEYVLS